MIHPMTAAHDEANATASLGHWVLEAIAAVQHDALVVVDRKGALIYHNPAAERLVGLQRGLSQDQNEWSMMYGVYYPDERTPFPSKDLPLVRALGGVDTSDCAMFVRNEWVPAGIHILLTASTIRDRDGTIRGAACMFRDITSIRKQEAQLREGARQMKAILDNIPDIAWLKDEHGRYVAVNQPFVEVVGKTATEDVIGLTDYDLWPPDLARRYRDDDDDVIQSGEHKRIEEPLVDVDGRTRWVETVKTRIVDDVGKVIGTTGIAHDITVRRESEEVMRTARDELEKRVRERTAELAEAQENLVRQERLAILGQLAGGVAHQIRNPLAAIMNATYVLKRHLSPGQHQNVEDAIRIIHDEVRHANIIITGLLDYARVRTPDRHPTSMVDLLERILDADWIPDNIRIERRLPKTNVVLDVDVDQLQGAISNLIRNAIDAMPSGGELLVSLDVSRSADEIEITVSDSGAGISPQVRPHLFEPLHSTKPSGIGLGLVTARRFVEAHGGTIFAVEVDRGARFAIRLPYPRTS